MTKDELKEKIKVLIKQVYTPNQVDLDKDSEVSLDAPKFPVLVKFPKLKEVIVNLLTDQYEVFMTNIEWVAPKPTTFRIVLGNNENFLLIYTERSWIAQVEGKNYYLLNLGEEEQATQAIARMLAYGMATGTSAEEANIEEPAAEEAAPEEKA
jgi:hypothetical protein